ncbi:MAG: hypothetical protein MMC33_004717 [Icmadophila ericetorum]|nr:hypothetical protein [Icmadophila ericetorum]
MHKQIRKTLSIGLLLYLHLPRSIAQPAVSLSEFQEISGFSLSCTAVYNSPIPGCTNEDFQSTSQCSASCIQGLEEITKELGNACAGTKVDTSTLIGLFFENKGVTAVCPNGQSTSPSYTVGSGTMTTVSTPPVQSTAVFSTTIAPPSPPPTTTTTAQIVVTTASPQKSTSTHTQQIASVASSPSTTASTAPASTVASVAPTPFSANTGTQTTFTTTILASSSSHNPDAILKTAINDGSAEIITSKAQQTASKNPDAFGGGGSPFEIAIPSSAVFALDRRWILFGMISSLGLLWL